MDYLPLLAKNIAAQLFLGSPGFKSGNFKGSPRREIRVPVSLPNDATHPSQNSERILVGKNDEDVLDLLSLRDRRSPHAHGKTAAADVGQLLVEGRLLPARKVGEHAPHGLVGRRVRPQ